VFHLLHRQASSSPSFFIAKLLHRPSPSSPISFIAHLLHRPSPSSSGLLPFYLLADASFPRFVADLFF
jgi:hypothetical protein